MLSRNYSVRELCLIALAAQSDIGPATINALTRAERKTDTSLKHLTNLDEGELYARSDLSQAQAQRVANVQYPLQIARDVINLLRKTDTYPIFRSDQHYPRSLIEHLGETAPPVLFIAGDISVISERTVAIVGSRRPSDATRRAAYQLGVSQARDGVTVVSGGARGIDTAGHQGALKTGKTVVVPPTGVTKHRWRNIDRGQLSPDQWCVLGQFPPQDPWRTRNALQRNHTIVALSDAVVGFEPRDEGGTWRSCRTALRMQKPLFIVNGSTKKDRRRGQAYFVNNGAVALSADHMPNPEEFHHLVEDYTAPPITTQPDLFT